jgi:hypothetical protein
MGNTEMVLRLVRRGQVYEEVYLTDLSMSTAQEDLRQKLVDVYKSCLEFLCFVDVEVERGYGHRFLEALVNPGRGEQKVSEMKELEKDLESAAHPCEAKSSEKHRKMLEGLDGIVAEVLQKLEKKDREAAMNYISTIPVGAHHVEKREKRTGDTCEWLTNHREFHAWEDSACSSVLWLQGQSESQCAKDPSMDEQVLAPQWEQERRFFPRKSYTVTGTATKVSTLEKRMRDSHSSIATTPTKAGGVLTQYFGATYDSSAKSPAVPIVFTKPRLRYTRKKDRSKTQSALKTVRRLWRKLSTAIPALPWYSML